MANDRLIKALSYTCRECDHTHTVEEWNTKIQSLFQRPLLLPEHQDAYYVCPSCNAQVSAPQLIPVDPLEEYHPPVKIRKMDMKIYSEMVPDGEKVYF